MVSREWLGTDLTLSEEKAHQWADVAVAELNCAVKMAQRFFLVDDLIDSFKVDLGALRTASFVNG